MNTNANHMVFTWLTFAWIGSVNKKIKPLESGHRDDFFYSIPMPILVVDKDLDVVDANREARTVFQKGVAFESDRSCGETIRCYYKFDSGQKCGKTKHCSECVVRNVVTKVFSENRIIRKRSQMCVQHQNHARKINFLMTAWPVTAGGLQLAMVMMEDLADLFQIGQILPMSAACKRIKIGEDQREDVESYINRNLGSDLSHGICPECQKNCTHI